MASKIGVYFDVQNIGGGLDVEALAEQVRSKWSDLTPVVKVLPMLSVAEDEVRADIEANGLDGVLFCGASPRDEATPWQPPVQVGNTRTCANSACSPTRTPTVPPSAARLPPC